MPNRINPESLKKNFTTENKLRITDFIEERIRKDCPGCSDRVMQISHIPGRNDAQPSVVVKLGLNHGEDISSLSGVNNKLHEAFGDAVSEPLANDYCAIFEIHGGPARLVQGIDRYEKAHDQGRQSAMIG